LDDVCTGPGIDEIDDTLNTPVAWEAAVSQAVEAGAAPAHHLCGRV